jgi:hypothetical protein
MSSRIRPASLSLFTGMILFTIGAVLSGCQGNTLSFSQDNTASVVTGTAFDGPVEGATVTLETFPPGSGVLGTATTDQHGSFTLATGALDPNGIYLLTVANGQTLDLATGVRITFGQGDYLWAIGKGSDFVSGMLSITPFTTMESTLALTFTGTGASPAHSFSQAESLWSGYLGFDPLKTAVADPTAGPGSVTPGGLYGLYLAGFSQLAANIGSAQNLAAGSANTLGLLAQIDSDLSDGVLNGKASGSTAALSYYGYTLSGDTLRKDLSAAVLEFLWNARNQTGLTPTQVAGSANALALNTSTLFPSGTPSSAPDPGTPSLLIQSPQPNLYYNGSLLVSGSASDDLGVGSLVLSSPDLSLPGGILAGNPILTQIDTTAYSDGAYDLLFTATDYAGNVATQSVPFEIDNTPPTISDLAPAPNAGLTFCTGTSEPVTVTGTLTDSGSGPKTIQVKELTPQSLTLTPLLSFLSGTQKSFQFSFLVPSTGGCHQTTFTFAITGYDNLFNSEPLSYTLTIQN